jgi:diguanylate cyclase (GGDEF)-like protein
VTERLARLTSKKDTLARSGSDEFIILMTGLKRVEDAAMFAQKIVESMRKPFKVEGHQLFTTASIGITLYPGDGQSPEALIKNADIALIREGL